MQITNFRKAWHAAVVLASLVAVLVLLSPSLTAQSSNGGIVGTVTDSSGAVVANATVTLTDIGTNAKRTSKSDAAGSFNFPAVPASNYKVEVTAAGFKGLVRSPITVNVANSVRVDVTLSVGATTETIEVTTQAPLLQTTSGTLGSEVEGAQVQAMPLNGRNPMNLITLVPGIVPQGMSQGSTGLNALNHTNNLGWNNYQIGGGIAGHGAEYIDGAPLNVLNNAVELIPTQDVVQEFKVSTNAVSAEFGAFGGGVVEMTTKSGTNAFHGSVYEYLRNDKFNANDFLTKGAKKVRPPWKQNQYGVVADGPIKKDKAFFLFDWEGFSARQATPQSFGIPSYNYEQGIFPQAITDPTGNCAITWYDASGNVTTTLASVAKSVIPSTCFDPTAVVMFKEYPATSSATPDVTKITTAPLSGNNAYQYNGRVDYNLTSNQRLFGRYTYWHLADTSALPLGVTQINSGKGFSKQITHQVVLGDTITLNPTTIVDIRASYLRGFIGNVAPTMGIDMSQFGPGAVALYAQSKFDIGVFPSMSGRDGLYNFAGSLTSGTDQYDSYDLGASFLKIMGNHTLKFGFDLRSQQDNNYSSTHDHNGQYNFQDGTTAPAGGGSSTGNAFASLLLGEYQTSSVTAASNVTAFSNSQGYYATDTWQVNRKLTVNMGLRWELPGGEAENHDKATVFLPDMNDPVTGYKGAAVLVNSASYSPRSVLPVRRNLVGPRFGFAYRVGANTAIRGGYGLDYLPVGVIQPQRNQPATTSPVAAAVTSTNTVVYHGLQNPFGVVTGSKILQPVGRDPNFVSSYFNQTLLSPVVANRYPYMQQWNLTVSHQMKGDFMVEVGYVGSKGTHLPAEAYLGVNQLPSSAYASLTPAQQAALSTTNTTWNGHSMTVGQSLRPFPYYKNLQNNGAFNGSDTFHALELQSQKRFRNGSQLMGIYTWSKMIGDTDTALGQLEANNTTLGFPQDYTNPRGDRAILGLNTPQRAVINYVLNLPFGKGQKFLSGVHGAADKVVSGWAVNGITSFQSGNPLGFSVSSGNSLTVKYGAGILRPNVTPGCAKVPSGTRWEKYLNSVNTKGATGFFNPACFTVPADFTFGTAPRNDNGVQDQGVDNSDFSVLKSTKIGERIDVQFRAEFFNLANHVRFANPGTGIGASNYNQIAKLANNPRLGHSHCE